MSSVRQNNQEVEKYLRQLAILKKIANESLRKSQLAKADLFEKLLKTIKKEIKEHKLIQAQANSFFQSTFRSLDGFIRNCYFQFRLNNADFQAMIIKRKYLQNNCIDKFCTKRFNELEKSEKRWLDEAVSLSKGKKILLQSKNNIRYCSLLTLTNKVIEILSKTYFFQTEIKNIESLIKLIKNACKNYNITPYHNFTHAVGVFLSFYEVAENEEIKKFFDPFQLFFSLLSCIFHDVQHDALTILFHIKTKSQIAIDYGNTSVLQKMHVSRTMKIIERDPQSNQIFMSMRQKDRQRARKIITKCIMATDMSRHYDLQRQLKEKKLSSENDQDREFLAAAILHACDIDNPTFQFQSYIYWANMICLQFNDQTLKEQLHNVEVTEFLKFNSMSYFYKNQLTFVNNVVYPFWQTLVQKFPILEEEKSYLQKIKENSELLQEHLRRNSESSHYKSIERYLNYQLSNK